MKHKIIGPLESIVGFKYVLDNRIIEIPLCNQVYFEYFLEPRLMVGNLYFRTKDNRQIRYTNLPLKDLEEFEKIYTQELIKRKFKLVSNF